MAIIEVDKHFDPDRIRDHLLGEHKWSKALRHPSLEDVDQTSRIFYCFHSNGRAVQKDGMGSLFVPADSDRP
jgi:hypothetical protein